MTATDSIAGVRAPRAASDSATAVVTVQALTKIYGKGARQVRALRGVDVTLERGSFTAVMGPSGSGKSTFLHCVAGLDRPTSGSVHLAGIDLGSLSEVALTKLRRRQMGFIFQAFNLLPALTVEQNIQLPARLAGHRLDKTWVGEVIARTGLGDRRRHRPGELSGGQQQRVAIARALAMRPDVIFADEPTGALDIDTGRQVLGLLRQCADDDGLTIVMVTHDPSAAAHADAVVFLADGQIVDTIHHPTAQAVASRMTGLGR